ncbi:Uncharacterised protein [Serratia rubidaea]|uniref:Putative adhesin Stv domain-containing protein n=1 Tax=Serratia rubidaea TaxID=61652 RepID=A0A4U9HAW6_SERRU|nr:hypothetical protein [Serratia rubidaea]QPR61698.1 hypothetical protein I6G83_12605 [Serratia rubidaea]CAI0916805.1 Uncharacterised protein [Serratia rubidaea]CAI1768941.1 Uncharacterised protein [Serratia rubidaea]VTP60870.1 Uncharacterised protein [Serratia rubidaea]HAY0636548.1 hypothetical protein [Serratia rubidaea]
MDLYQNTVGSNLYVWSHKRAAPSANECIITAHGASRTSKSGMSSELKDVELVYYTRHGETLSDPSLLQMIIGAVPQYESMKANASHDYDLGKYTNSQVNGGKRHNEANESYHSVRNLYNTADAKPQELRDNAARFRSAGMVTHADNLERDAAQYKNITQYDVITLRNRIHRSFNSLTLSEVIRELRRYGYKYQRIHCAFCR